MPPNQFSNRPLYLQLHDALAERIITAEWKPGQAIPNEGELAREFCVSLGTMRKALSLMESERLITRRQGRGSFVNDQTSKELADRFCDIHRTDGQSLPGVVGAAQILEAFANEEECLRLQLRSQDSVWRISRVRQYQGRPFMYEEVSLPTTLFPGLKDRIDSRIVVLAQRYGLLLGVAEERLSIGAASDAAAKALDVLQASPVIVLDRVVRTIHGQPIEWRVGQCNLGSNYYLAHFV